MASEARTPNQRWETGTPHDPRSLAIYENIENIDLAMNEDQFGFKSGGDGDNGEALMYLLDEHFQQQDEKAVPDLASVVKDVLLELASARSKFKSFPSEHHGYAVLLEEVDELWKEVQSKDATPENVRAEAVQVAAMGIRFILDLCGPGERKDAREES